MITTITIVIVVLVLLLVGYLKYKRQPVSFEGICNAFVIRQSSDVVTTVPTQTPTASVEPATPAPVATTA